jgi:DNA-binding transcriptional MerR regulator
VTATFLTASEAARQLSVSPKALRVYEQRGLLAPVRSEAGWRTYGPAEMARAAEIVALRALGLSLAQVAQVLGGNPQCLAPALTAHQTLLEGQVQRLTQTIAKLRGLRADLDRGEVPAAGDLARFARPSSEAAIAFDLPWPWGGERFVLRDLRALNYVIGPLGSGKTRLAHAIASALPGALFLGLDRLNDGGVAAHRQLDADPALKTRVDQSLSWLVDEGAEVSAALIALLVALEAEGPTILVVDMVEQGLSQASQEALIAHLRHRASTARPLFLLTRSSAFLDLAAMGHDEAIIFCPANHSPPFEVPPNPGARGYEAVATCLASPEVRARTEGVIAWRPQVA